jgi:hypothetical protein
MRIQVAIPEAHVSKPILDAALEGVTRLNERLIRSGVVPPFDEVKTGIRWKPEPPGAEHFDHAAMVLDRGWGDCDDLGPYKAASDRVTGRDPKAKAVVRRSGPKRWHSYVEHSDGSSSDPSKECGMPGPASVVGIRGAVQPVMFGHHHAVGGTYVATPHLALRPVPGIWGQDESWQARADLPWHWQPGKSAGDIAMVSLHSSPVSDQAVVGAVLGALRLGEASGLARDEHLDRLEAICDACHGASWEELADEYGPEHATAAGQIVGSFFGSLGKKLKRAVKKGISYTPAAMAWKTLKPLARQALPLAQAALPFVPGVSPVASMALRAASPALQQLVRSGRHLSPKERQHMHLTSPPLYSREDVIQAWDRWA